MLTVLTEFLSVLVRCIYSLDLVCRCYIESKTKWSDRIFFESESIEMLLHRNWKISRSVYVVLQFFLYYALHCIFDYASREKNVHHNTTIVSHNLYWFFRRNWFFHLSISCNVCVYVNMEFHVNADNSTKSRFLCKCLLRIIWMSMWSATIRLPNAIIEPDYKNE